MKTDVGQFIAKKVDAYVEEAHLALIKGVSPGNSGEEMQRRLGVYQAAVWVQGLLTTAEAEFIQRMNLDDDEQ